MLLNIFSAKRKTYLFARHITVKHPKPNLFFDNFTAFQRIIVILLKVFSAAKLYR